MTGGSTTNPRQWQSFRGPPGLRAEVHVLSRQLAYQHCSAQCVEPTWNSKHTHTPRLLEDRGSSFVEVWGDLVACVLMAVSQKGSPVMSWMGGAGTALSFH